MVPWEIPEIITIGIPAYNEEKSIVRTLKTVVNQTTTIKKEILVCLNGCVDDTERNILSYNNSLPSSKKAQNNIKILKINEANKPKAINFIKKNACSRLIFFLDADMILSLDSFDLMLQASQSTDVSIPIISAHLKYLSVEKYVDSAYQSLVQEEETREIAHELKSKYPDKKLKLINLFNNITNNYSERERITGSLYLIQNENVCEIPHHIISEDTFLFRKHSNPKRFRFIREANAYHLPLKNLKDFFNYRSRAEAGLFQLDEMGLKEKSNIVKGFSVFKHMGILEYLALPIFASYIIISKINGYIKYKKKKIKVGFGQQKSTKEL